MGGVTRDENVVSAVALEKNTVGLVDLKGSFSGGLRQNRQDPEVTGLECERGIRIPDWRL